MGRVIKKNRLQSPAIPINHANRDLLALTIASRYRARFIDSAKKDLVQACTNYIRKVLNDPDAGHTSDLLDQMIRNKVRPNGATITVHPGNKSFRAGQGMVADCGLETEFNSSLGLNDCIIKSDGIKIDASLDTALHIVDAVLEYEQKETDTNAKKHKNSIEREEN